MAGFGGGDLSVKVYRINGQSKDYCCTLQNPENLNEGTIQDLGYGPGRYILHLVLDGEFRKAINVSLAAPVRQQQEQQPGVDSITRMLLERLASLENRLMQQPAPEREPITALADAMLKIQQVQGGGQSRELPIETVMRCIELGKSLNTADDSTGAIVRDILKEAAPTIAQYLSARSQQPQQPQASIPAEARMVESEQDRLDRGLLEGLVYLKKMCIAGVDPGLFVDVIIVNRESADYAYLIHKVLTQPFEDFAQRDPEINTAAYRPFFEFIYHGLRSAFTPENPVDANPGGKGGNKGHVNGNGGPGPKGSAKP